MSAAIEIRFLKLPARIHRGNPCWVNPLLVERREFFDRRKNPFFNHADVALYLAYKDGVPVGRISAHISHTHNEYHQEKTGFFGFFETIDDYAVAESLLQTAVDWVREKGMERARGPMNFTTNHETGLLVDGFDRPPVIMMSYNPKYYPEFFERFGLAKAMDLYAYYGTARQQIPERVTRVIERVKKRSRCTIRAIDFDNFDREIAAIKEIYNGAWADNWGFVPLTDEEFDFTAKDMKKIADPELILIAEDNGRAVGFSMGLPDFNQVLIRLNGRMLPFGLLKLLWLTKVRRVINGLRVVTMGILPEYRKRGLDNIFYLETFNRGVARGYRWGEFSWVLENNRLMNRVPENLGYQRYKTYRVYDYTLGS
jgi:GNAT superfamily N-acetyltransferase